MSVQHEEMEMAGELDRIVRVAITAAAQIIERRARAQASDNRQQMQQVREDALRQLRGNGKASWGPGAGQDDLMMKEVRYPLDVSSWRGPTYTERVVKATDAEREALRSPEENARWEQAIPDYLQSYITNVAESFDENLNSENPHVEGRVSSARLRFLRESVVDSRLLDEAWARTGKSAPRPHVEAESGEGAEPLVNAWRRVLHDGARGDVAAAQQFAVLTPYVQRITGVRVHELLSDAVSDAAALRDEREQARETGVVIDDALDEALMTHLEEPVEIARGAADEQAWQQASRAQEQAAIALVQEHTPQWFQRGFVMSDPGYEAELRSFAAFDEYDVLREFAATGQMRPEVMHRVWARAESLKEVEVSPATVILPPRSDASSEEFAAYWRATATPDRAQGWSRPPRDAAEALADPEVTEAMKRREEAMNRYQGVAAAQYAAVEEVLERFTPEWFREGSRAPGDGLLLDEERSLAAMRHLRSTGRLADADLHVTWANYARRNPSQVPEGVELPADDASPEELEAFWRQTGPTEDEVSEEGRELRQVAEQDRGTAPSKAKTPAEAEHRRQAWAGAQAEFTSNLNGSPSETEAKQAWDNAPRGVKYGLYWKHYDTGSGSDVQGDSLEQAEVSSPQMHAPGISGSEVVRDRGTAPSKAKTPAEAEHRRQAWAGAQAEFTSDLPGSPSSAEAKQAWDSAPSGVKYGLYWKHYDADSGVERAAKQPRDNGFAPSKAATPAEKARREQAWKQARADHRAGLPAETTALEAAQQWKALDWQDQALYYTNAYERAEQAAQETPAPESRPLSRERVVELNEVAADYYRGNLEGSRGGAYLADRLGGDAVRAGDFQLGYAPAGWTNLTTHLRKAGATDEEIVGAGLGRVSSRGSVIDAFRDRAMIGVRDRDGDLVGFVGRDLSGDERAPKYINTGATPAYTKGDHLLGAYEAREGAPVVRVEGPFDALAVHVGSRGQVAGIAPLGTALTSTQAEQLAEMAKDLRVYLGTDADAAGLSAAAEDYWTLSERGVDVRMVQWPQGQDPAQLLHDSPDVMRAYMTTLDSSPSAAPVAMSKVLDEHTEGLRAGEADAFEEVAALEERMRAHLPEQEAYELSQYVSRRIDELRGEVDDFATDETVNQGREDALDAEGSAALEAGDAQRADVLEGQEQHAGENADIARSREDSAQQELGAAYDRAAESDLGQLDAGSEQWTREAQQARVVSARGYTRSTQDMLNEQASGRAVHAKPQVNTFVQGARRQRLSR